MTEAFEEFDGVSDMPGLVQEWANGLGGDNLALRAGYELRGEETVRYIGDGRDAWPQCAVEVFEWVSTPYWVVHSAVNGADEWTVWRSEDDANRAFEALHRAHCHSASECVFDERDCQYAGAPKN